MTISRGFVPGVLLLFVACGSGGVGPTGGPTDATVTIIEYSDFQCSFCARIYTTVETQVLKEYGAKVRFVFKNYPLTAVHPWAEDAAVVAACAFRQGNDPFWTMYNGLYSKQSEITKDNLAAKAAEIAESGGIDVAKLKECIDGKQSLDAVKADAGEARALGPQALGGMMEGDGKGKPANDCLVEQRVDATPPPSRPTITSNDCDGTCDADATQNIQCSFRVALCVNVTGDSACVPSSTVLKRVIAKVKGVKGLKKLDLPL